MDRRESVDTGFVDGRGLIVEDRRNELFMVLGVALTLLIVAVLMWLAIADNLFGTGTALVPSSPSVSSPSQSWLLPGSVSQARGSELSLSLGSMSADQMSSYIDTQAPNDNVGSWPNMTNPSAKPAEPNGSVANPVQEITVGVPGADPVPFDFGEMTGEPWSPPESHGSVALGSLSTQADSVLQDDGEINYQLSLSIDDATDGPVSIVVRAEGAQFPASQCFSAEPVYEGVYPPNACTVQAPGTSGFLPLSSVFADGTGSSIFMSGESRLIYTFRPRNSGTYLFDFSAAVPSGFPGDNGTSRSVMTTAQLFRGATLVSTVQLKTDISSS